VDDASGLRKVLFLPGRPVTGELIMVACITAEVIVAVAGYDLLSGHRHGSSISTGFYRLTGPLQTAV
jgi:hypothetical protein